MLEVVKHGILLSKTTLDFENEAVCNPAIIINKEGIHMFYRAVSARNYSSIGYCKLSDPVTVDSRLDTGLIVSQYEYEMHGLEDPRIVCIDNVYFLTYTAYDGINALGALALSDDLINFKKMGILVPRITNTEFRELAATKNGLYEKYVDYNEYNLSSETQHRTEYLWNKNVIFFPRRINGSIWFLHRIRPDIFIVEISDLSDLTTLFWRNYFFNLDRGLLMTSKYPHEIEYIGGGCPPIETKAGWLIIYHGVHQTVEGNIYSACAALLDLENPTIELARLDKPLFSPEFEWEKSGVVNNVCFPTGAIIEDDILYIYYGAADEQIAVASIAIDQLITELQLNLNTNGNRSNEN